MGKTVLVTGAAGFIGSHTAEALVRRGDDVLGLDNFDPYYDPARKRANVEELRVGTAGAPGRFELVEGDLCDGRLVGDLVGSRRWDAIVHLGALAGVRASVADPARYLEVNLGGTLHLLEAARRTPVGNFVFASTSSAYGSTTRIPFVETDPADRPHAPYPASKRAAELLGHAYHHLHRIPFTALRFFTVYGPRGRPDMFPFKLLENLYFGRDVPLFHGGELYRDWTSVLDIVDGVVRAVDRPLGYEVLNLGRGEPVKVSEFVAVMERLTGKVARLRPEPLPDADVAYTFADITRARERLGYSPRLTLEEGARAFVDWYRRAVCRENV